MTKIAAFTALHYGGDYLGAAIRSVAPCVDEWLFAYSPVGSHGSVTSQRCPETREDLYAIADRALNECECPSKWWTEHWPHEGYQRDSVYRHTDADLIIVVDADEVWYPGAVFLAIQESLDHQDTKSGRVPFVHFWRSFNWACTDPSWPVRVLRPGLPDGDSYLDTAPVLHFGYARTPEAIQYKMLIHGHRGEWRPEWYSQKFLPWTPEAGPFEDLHPTNRDFWTAKPYTNVLPDALQDHPYRDMAVIR